MDRRNSSSGAESLHHPATAREREAEAPFATAASSENESARLAEKEGALVSESTRRGLLESELQRLESSGARTVRDKQRLAQLTEELQTVETNLAGLRRWLRTQAPQ